MSERVEGPGGAEGAPLLDYVALYQRVGRGAFAREHHYPVLVRKDVAADSLNVGFHTAFSDSSGARPPRRPRSALALNGPVVRIEKRVGAPFAERIGVGRARNVDVCLALPRLSKFHAFFSCSDDLSKFFLTDAGSKNGTFVNGQQLEQRHAAELQNGDEVGLGPYSFVFLTPQGFAELLAKRSEVGI